MYYELRVNGEHPIYPPECCCCGAIPATTVKKHQQAFPSCAECKPHVRDTWLPFLKSELPPGHAGSRPAVTVRYEGDVMVLEFGREMYARYFAVLNRVHLAGWNDALARPLPIEFERRAKLPVKETILVGSDPSCDFVSPRLPAQAFSITWTPGGHWIDRIDRKMRVDGCETKGYVIDGDLLSSGDEVFTVRIPSMSLETDGMKKAKLLDRIDRISIVDPLRMHDESLIADALLQFTNRPYDMPQPPKPVIPKPAPPPAICVCDRYAKNPIHSAAEFLYESDRANFKVAPDDGPGSYTNGWECRVCGRHWIVEMFEGSGANVTYRWRQVHN